MNLHLLAFGKLKTPGLRESADYYIRLLNSWVKATETELKPLKVTEKSPQLRKKIQGQEGQLLQAAYLKLGSRSKLVLLEESGKSLTTLKWAEQIEGWEASAPNVMLCVGSSLGFSEDIRNQADFRISLGPHTMPHELARVVLYEQLYRAWSVTRGHPYHNEGS